MKITLVLGYLAKGGTERQVAYLSSGLVERGHDVTILLLGRQLEDDYPVATGVKVHALRVTELRHSVSGFRKLRAALRSSDVVYSFLDLANAICALCMPSRASTQVPLVWGLRAANTGTSRLSRFGLLLSLRLCGRADAMIANSNAVRDYYQQQGFACSRFWVLPNGVAVAQVQPPIDLDLPSDGFVALVLARVAQEKRQELGLRLLKYMPRLHLVFAGDGASELPGRWRERGLADAGDLARCRFVEHQADVAPLLQAADVLLSLSYAEGFPNAVLEAMAHEVPVVATAVGGVPELLAGGREAGDSEAGLALGWLVPTANPQQDVELLAKALEQVQAGGSQVQQRINAARVRIDERYAVDRMVEDTLARLAQLVGR